MKQRMSLRTLSLACLYFLHWVGRKDMICDSLQGLPKRGQNWTLQGGPLLISSGYFLTLFETRFLCTGVQKWTLSRLNPVPP